MSILDKAYHQKMELQSKRNILIVDDDMTLLSKLVMQFKLDHDIGTIFVAHSAQEGLKIIAKSHVDLLILDMVMPYMDGIAFLEYCQNHQLINQTKVIAMGENIDQNLVLEAINMGASHFLYKPLDLSVLVSRSRTILNLKQDHSTHEVSLDIFALRTLLLDSGLPVHTLGYKYFLEAVKFVLMEELEVFSITKSIYPYVASIFQTSGSNVDKAMRHALTLAYDQNSENLSHFLRLMNYKDYTKKPSNSEFISLILENLRQSNGFQSLKS